MKHTSAGLKALVLVAAAAFATGCAAGGATTLDRPAPVQRPAAARGHGVSSHVVLPSHKLVSGKSERGVLVISNKTRRVIPWTCGYLQFQLVNAQHPLERHPTPCSLEGKALRVGTTRIPFTLSATDVVCQGSCTALPVGTYRTQMYPGPPVAVRPGALTVHVVARVKSAK